MKDKKRTCRAWLFFIVSIVITITLRITSAFLSTSELYDIRLIIDCLYFLFMFVTIASCVHLKRARKESNKEQEQGDGSGISVEE